MTIKLCWRESIIKYQLIDKLIKYSWWWWIRNRLYIRWRKKRMKYLWIGQTYIGVEYKAMPKNLHKIIHSSCDHSITSCHFLCPIYRIDPIDTVPCIALFQHPPIIQVRTITNTSMEQRFMLWSAGWPFVR